LHPKFNGLKEIAVAVLNWNGQKLLEEFLPSVVQHSANAEVFVVDNNSSDGSISYLTSNFPSVKIIQTNSNLGYAGGYNFALAEIKNPFIVLLNSDIETTENWLDAPLKLLKEDERIGACQPKIKAYKDKESFEYAGAAGGFIDYLGYPFCRGRLFETLEKDNGQYEDSREIFWASGACLFVNRKAFFDAGELDETFFAHMEEIDLCWRMKNNGYKIFYTSDSTVYHLGGGTLNSQSTQKTFLNFRNNLYLLFKNLPATSLFPILFSRLILDGVAALKFALDLKPKHSIAIVKAHFAFYVNFNRLAKERRNYYYKLKGLKSSQMYNNSIIIEHFLKGTKTFADLKGKFKY
jgi:GT2 family glycosyltransferase